jgi:uncharacterized protein YuzE
MSEEAKEVKQEAKAPEAKAEPKEKTFTQAEVDKIISKRLAKEKKAMPSDEDLKAFEDWRSGQKEQEVQNISELQAELERVKAENAAIKVDNALNMALLSAGVTDIDYMAFKIKSDHELKIDENGKIEGIDTILESSKTAYPNQFGKTEATADKKYIPNELPNGEGNKGISLEQFNKMGYQERNELFRSNPEQYYKLTGKK